MGAQASDVRYLRARFATRLPADARYTASHHWMREVEPGLWHVGLTGFATRMLGDLVELELERQPGDPVELGTQMGWIEGFKALSNLYCVATGELASGNVALAGDATLLDRDPCRRGWLYSVRGAPDPDSVDVDSYVGILDATIDRMLAEAQA